MLAENPPSVSPASGRESDAPPVFALVRPLFTVVCCALVFLAALVVVCLFITQGNYHAGIEAAAKAPADPLAILSYARAWDFAVVKFSTVFLGFGVILIGALYVLHKAEVGFQMSVDGPAGKGALQSSSPGLVMIALGVVLLIFALETKSEVSYTPGLSPGPSADVKTMPEVKP